MTKRKSDTEKIEPQNQCVKCQYIKSRYGNISYCTLRKGMVSFIRHLDCSDFASGE